MTRLKHRMRWAAVKMRASLLLTTLSLAFGLSAATPLPAQTQKPPDAQAAKLDSAEAHKELGVDLASKGRYDEAIAEFSKAVALKPDYAKAHYNLGRTFDEKGEYDKVIAHYGLGLILDRKGYLDGAIAEYQAALALDPGGAEGHYHLGRDLRDNGNLKTALEELQLASALDPNNATYTKALNDLQQQMNH